MINNPDDIPDTEESVLIQKYITNPYLIRLVLDINEYSPPKTSCLLSEDATLKFSFLGRRILTGIRLN